MCGRYTLATPSPTELRARTTAANAAIAPLRDRMPVVLIPVRPAAVEVRPAAVEVRPAAVEVRPAAVEVRPATGTAAFGSPPAAKRRW